MFCLTAIFSAALAMPVFAENSTAGDIVQAVIDKDGKQRVEILGGSYFFKPHHRRGSRLLASFILGPTGGSPSTT